MKIRAFITTYDREEMLRETVTHLNKNGIIPIIKDDGSNYPIDLPQYFRHNHRGKKGYWKTWDEILKTCETSEAELYLFMPDDFQDLDVERMVKLHNKFKGEPYVYNLINDGREWEWVKTIPLEIDEETIQIGFCDCGFFCNREALEKIGFYMKEVSKKRWEVYGEQTSSGVGQRLTKRLNENRVKIYKPVKSLCYHGDHESKMHREERKRNPLISK